MAAAHASRSLATTRRAGASPSTPRATGCASPRGTSVARRLGELCAAPAAEGLQRRYRNGALGSSISALRVRAPTVRERCRDARRQRDRAHADARAAAAEAAPAGVYRCAICGEDFASLDAAHVATLASARLPRRPRALQWRRRWRPPPSKRAPPERRRRPPPPPPRRPPPPPPQTRPRPRASRCGGTERRRRCRWSARLEVDSHGVAAGSARNHSGRRVAEGRLLLNGVPVEGLACSAPATS